MRPLALLLALVLGVPACSSGEQEPTRRSQREADSVLAASKIPHAKAVGRALDAADAGAARAAAIDSLSSQ